MVVSYGLHHLALAVERTELHGLHGIHSAANATLPELHLWAARVQVFLSAGTPVSPALRCVTVLTIFFFAVYLTAVFGRLMRIIASCWSNTHIQHTTFEKKIAEASEALAIAPMMSILMISARLRALQIDPSGDPERWVQLLMYLSTGAFFLRFVLDLALTGPRAAEGIWKKCLEGAYLAVTVVLYSCCAAILLNTFTMRLSGRHSDEARVPPLPHMMNCVAALTAAYLVESLLFEVMSAVFRYFRQVPTYAYKDDPEDGCFEDCTQLNGLPSGFPQTRAEEFMMVELVSMQFPLMLCVLLVGITMRGLQLKLEPSTWAVVAMYAVTGSIVMQAIWASFAAANRLARSLSDPSVRPIAGQERSCFEWRHFTTNRNLQLWPFAAGAAAPGGPDAAAGGVRRPLHWCLAGVWAAMMACLYIGTTMILVSVFTMEEKPLSILWTEDQLGLLGRFSGHPMAFKPLAVAMRCVVILTVVYFGAYLCMILGGAVHGPTRKWAACVLNGVQRSLAFVPMLCVMMIAVRLRAMQLKMRDPQSWAQNSMYVATFAVIVQVGCSLVQSTEDSFDDPDREIPDIAVKVATIALLSVRYVATMTLYSAVAVLIAALLVMEPDA
mmetsp:Transcript_7720/g.20811  ORF Transcript_7720/g.20811 Transcript_7720/m.20811 type:complete len:611 (-) Transcript_7720:226-2058(-)